MGIKISPKNQQTLKFQLVFKANILWYNNLCMSNSFYITTTLPYVNADPHIGFAQEIVAADVIARYQKNLGRDVVFNTGTDEHGQKIYQNAQESGKNPQDYVDLYAAKFSDLKTMLNLDYTNFIRTTNKDHIAAAQEFWNLCAKKGDIYKKMYKTNYCVGCELEKQSSELVDGKCPLHPNKELEIIEEENYFFKFSKYQSDLLNLFEANQEFVKPEGKLKEIKSFVEGGLKDFSISRLKTKMPWGVPVPNDEEHVMYVWFDALVNYVSTLGWPNDQDNFNKFWPVVQLAGKDNLRQQAAMWQAMLISAGLPNSKQILINGFISVEGQKMSKSLGNVISPKEMVERYGTDGTRYLLMNLSPFGTDADVSWEKFDIDFTANLSNGLGNLCSRVAKMCEKLDLNNPHNSVNLKPLASISIDGKQVETISHRNMSNFNLGDEIKYIWLNQKVLDEVEKDLSIHELDKNISDNKPWKMGDEEATKYLTNVAIPSILIIASKLLPFMPETAKKIISHFSNKKITGLEPLFPRLGK